LIRCLLIIATAMIVGCASKPQTADVQRIREAGGKDYVLLSLSKPTREKEFNIHCLCIASPSARYSIVLPTVPLQASRYEALDLRAKNAGAYPAQDIALVSGDVTFATANRQVIVSLMTASGPFPGNGTYMLAGGAP